MFAPKVAKPQMKAAANPTNKLAPQRWTLARFGGHSEQAADPESLTARGATCAPSWDLSKIPVFPPDRASRPQASSPVTVPPPPGTVQPKLIVGHVNDPLEHEADRVADHFFPDISISPLSSLEPALKRRGKGDGDPEKLQGSGSEVAGAPAPSVPMQSPKPAGPGAGAAGTACALPPAPVWSASKHVVPTFSLDEQVAPRSNSKASTTNTDDPTFVGNVAADTTSCLWRYQFASIHGNGRIRIVYFTSDRYPAPMPMDDTGDLTNMTKTNYQAAVDDLTRNKEGIPDFWSAYRAEPVHEHYHWETEWQGEVKKGIARAESLRGALCRARRSRHDRRCREDPRSPGRQGLQRRDEGGTHRL